MLSGLRKRLDRIEKRLAQRKEQVKICNCRTDTSFHGARCLEAILKRTSRICPRHGFRDLGFFMYAPIWMTLKPEDNQFCPCSQDPWRSYLLSPRPHTEEMRDAARYGPAGPGKGPGFDFKEDGRQIDAIVADYWEDRRKFVEETKRQLPGRAEIRKLVWARERARRNAL